MKERGEEDPEYLICLRAIAQTLMRLEEYPRAREAMARLAAIHARLDTDDSARADALWGEALACYNLRDFSAAIQAAEALLELEVTGDVRWETHRLLGAAYREVNDFAASLPYLRASAEGAKATHGDSSREYALALHKLGQTLVDLDKLDEARMSFESALSIIKGLDGDHSDDVAALKNALGVVARSAGQIEDAERHLKEAMAIKEELSSPNDAIAIASEFRSHAGHEGRLSRCLRTTREID